MNERQLAQHVDFWKERAEAAERELARLTQELNEYAERLAWHREERDAYLKGNLWVARAAEERERAEAAERELARLQAALDEISGLTNVGFPIWEIANAALAALEEQQP